jgi:hypothetical protein
MSAADTRSELKADRRQRKADTGHETAKGKLTGARKLMNM